MYTHSHVSAYPQRPFTPEIPDNLPLVTLQPSTTHRAEEHSVTGLDPLSRDLATLASRAPFYSHAPEVLQMEVRCQGDNLRLLRQAFHQMAGHWHAHGTVTPMPAQLVQDVADLLAPPHAAPVAHHLDTRTVLPHRVAALALSICCDDELSADAQLKALAQNVPTAVLGAHNALFPAHTKSILSANGNPHLPPRLGHASTPLPLTLFPYALPLHLCAWLEHAVRWVHPTATFTPACALLAQSALQTRAVELTLATLREDVARTLAARGIDPHAVKAH